MGRTTYHWTGIFGKPERVREEHYIDDMGRWDSSFYRKDGSAMIQKPTPLELYRTKESLQKAIRYKARVRKAIMEVEYD